MRDTDGRTVASVLYDVMMREQGEERANQVREIEGVRGLHIMAVSWPAAVPQVCQMLGLYPRPVV